MTVKVENYTERRESVQAVKWNGCWEDAAAVACLFRSLLGFEVSGDTLTVLRGPKEGGSIVICRGTYIILDSEGYAKECVIHTEFSKRWMKETVRSVSDHWTGRPTP